MGARQTDPETGIRRSTHPNTWTWGADKMSTTFFLHELLVPPAGLEKNVQSRLICRGQKFNTGFCFSNSSATAGISQQNPGISRQKSLISLVSRDVPNFLPPTPSCGRPLPHRKISGLKSLGLCSFFLLEIFNLAWELQSRFKYFNLDLQDSPNP